MKFDGCPSGMYPMDSDYPGDYENLDAMIEYAEKASDVLNFPVSWHLTEGESDEEDMFELTFIMPRKNGRTWSLRTNDFDSDRAVEWVLDFTKRAATEWYGWEE